MEFFVHAPDASPESNHMTLPLDDIAEFRMQGAEASNLANTGSPTVFIPWTVLLRNACPLLFQKTYRDAIFSHLQTPNWWPKKGTRHALLALF